MGAGPRPGRECPSAARRPDASRRNLGEAGTQVCGHLTPGQSGCQDTFRSAAHAEDPTGRDRGHPEGFVPQGSGCGNFRSWIKLTQPLIDTTAHAGPKTQTRTHHLAQAVGSNPALIRIGLPVAIDFVMRSFSASSGTISAAPFVIKSSWSSSEANVLISLSIKTQLHPTYPMSPQPRIPPEIAL
jgi:hypothetical protein